MVVHKRNRVKPDSARYWWFGSTSEIKEDPVAAKAYNSWRDQRHRCRNSKLDCYKYYGAKGIKVKYSSREFVGWWVEQQKKLKLKKPTISRINHDGHYEFGNIKLEEHIDNCVKDTFVRHGAPGLKCKRRVVIYDYQTMEPLMIANSLIEASRLTGVLHTNVSAIAGKRRKSQSGKGYTFRYIEETPYV